MSQVRSGAQPLLVVTLAGLVYGVGADWLFQQTSDVWVGTLSLSFLLLVPATLGILTVVLAPAHYKRSWAFACFAPWGVCAAVGLAVTLLAMELWICVVIGLPLFLAMSSLGGVSAAWLYRRRGGTARGDMLAFGLLLLAPFLVMPLEARASLAQQERVVHAQVRMQAAPETVWKEFVAVPAIRAGEGRFAWFRVLGLPSPVAASLTGAGVGAMRHARYSNGLQVVEPVLVWEPPLRYRFRVDLEPASLPSPLWQAAEGRALDVRHVEYRVEPQADGGVLLHLESRYRLATPINGYAGLWMDFLLGDFQRYILDVVKGRAERSVGSSEDRQRRGTMGDRIDADTQMGTVALVVADLARSLDYYQQRIGLSLLERSDGTARLGVGGRELLRLQEQPGARPFPRGHTGLYHFAILTPSRAALGRSLQHLMDTQTPIGGASDHGVSEALYLTDPDGHGIEIYRDRPREEWPVSQGQLQMVVDPLDAQAVLAAGGSAAWRGMEDGTTVGHVHLHVAQIQAAESFYVDLVGFDLIQRYGGQASFVSAGGYHHHLGLNVWAGIGAPPAPADAARLLWYEIRLPSSTALDAVLARLRAGQVALEPQARGWLAHDPAQNALLLRA